MKRSNTILVILALLISAGTGSAQVQQRNDNPIYTLRINVVERNTKAINYRPRSGSTTIDFRGTALMAAARGEAKVESKQGYMEVEVEFDNLQAATRFGPEILTYVMWAISPEGRASNMGEVILNGTKSKLNVTTELQAFGMIVTAEPYYAVVQPSDIVVMENFVRAGTVGKVEEIDAKFELLERGQYTVNVLPADLKPIPLDRNTPLDLYQARNAVRIAGWAGAAASASESYNKAVTLLAQAEAYKARNAGSRPIAMTSREAVQTAEDARLITLKAQAEARLEQERAVAAGQVAQANTAASNARADANDADSARVRAEADANAAAERAAADARALADRTRLDTEQAAQRAARERDAAQAASELARKTAAEQSEREKQELRSKLVQQLNLILQTRDSARGLIVNMSDVLFDSGMFRLKPGAREKLAQISGIVLAHPSLKLEIEGHTDSVGTDALNMKLSESRANTVRDFLVERGINASSVLSRGFGEGQPVATNDTATGRQQNRRVEMVVSGDVIGTSAARLN